MSFNVNPRESMSRADFYENKFRHYPEESRLREARRLEALKDVIEPESSRVERRMTEKFMKGVFHQEGASTRYIKKVGQFISVAVYEPAVKIALFLPKLIFQYALPFALNVFSTLFNKINGGAQVVGDWLSALASLVAEQFSRLFKFNLKRTQKSEKSGDNKAFASLKRRASAFIAPLKEQINRWGRALLKAGDEVGKKMAKKIETLTQTIHKFSLKIAQTLTPYRVKLGLFARLFAWIKAQIIKAAQKLKSTALSAKTLIVKAALTLKELRHLKVIPVALASFLFSILQQNYDSWIKPCLIWLSPIFVYIYAALKRAASGLLARLKHKQEQLTQALKKLHPLIRWVNPLAQRLKNHLNNLLERIITVSRQALNFVTKTSSTLLSAFFAKFSKLTQSLSKVSTKIKSSFIKIAAYLVTLPKMLLKSLLALCHATLFFLKQLSLALFTVYIFIKIFFRILINEIKQSQ